MTMRKLLTICVIALTGFWGGCSGKAGDIDNIECKLEMRNGVPVMLIDSKPIVPMMVWGSKNYKLAHTAAFVKANGIKLYTSKLDLYWPKDGEKYDFTEADYEMESLLKNDPQGLYMPRIKLDPPKWWVEKNPDQMPVWENGKTEQTYVSVTSDKWLKEACVHIDALVRHLEAKRGKHIFAYHPGAMNSYEWYYTSTIWRHRDWGLKNYEKPFQAAFQRWLRNRYVNIARLNKSWQSSYASFKEIPVPSPEKRLKTAHGLLRNPVSEKDKRCNG